MQFTDATISILKNFSTINPSIVLKKGNQLRTMSPQKTVMAMAKIEEDIPQEAGVYDVSRFLSVLALYEKPQVDFGDKAFTISEGKRKTKYVYSDPSMIISPPDKDVKIPDADVTVSVSWNDLQSVIKAAGVLQLPEIAFVGDGGKCFLRAIDNSNPTADTFGIELSETEDEFTLIIKTEYLKLLPFDYTVNLSSKGISCFEASSIKYFIAVDSKSTYKKG